jgi:hypothetical protein
MTNNEFTQIWQQTRDVIGPLADLLGQLNAADSDGNPLPSFWASSQSVYGKVREALRYAVLDSGFNLDILEGDGPNWGGNGRTDLWSADLLDYLRAKVVSPDFKLVLALRNGDVEKYQFATLDEALAAKREEVKWVTCSSATVYVGGEYHSHLVGEFVIAKDAKREVNDWEPVVLDLLERCVRHCIFPVAVDNGGGFEQVQSVASAAAESSASDEAVITFRDTQGNRCKVYIVLGNEPHELVCDYSAHLPALQDVVDEFQDAWEGRECPTKWV